MVKRIIEERVVTVPEVKELLAEAEREREITPLERMTLDYAMKFANVGANTSRKIMDVLTKKFGLPPHKVAQLVNCLPKHPEELRMVLTERREYIPLDKAKEIFRAMEEAMSE